MLSLTPAERLQVVRRNANEILKLRQNRRQGVRNFKR
jgi:hypothetical protein